MIAVHLDVARVDVAPQAPNGAEIRDQIRQSIQEAAQQARDAAQQAGDARQRVRDAQQRVRDAQQRVRDARSAEAARDAQSALRDANAALHDAQMELQSLRGTVMVQTGTVPPNMQDVIPPQAVSISIAFFIMCAVIIIGWPIARAFGRRIERRGETAAALEPGLASQLHRIEQAVDAMAIEIERISESQRFMAKLQSDSAQRAAIATAERR